MDTAGGPGLVGARSSSRGRVVGLVRVVVGVLLVGASGCGRDGTGDGSPDQADATATTTTASATTTTASAPTTGEPTCEDGTLDDRGFILCAADGGTDQRLIVALHGRGSSADEMRTVTGLDRHAAEAGLAVVYPQAVDRGWGDDTFTSAVRPAGNEDVAFLDALVRELRADLRIDDGPIGMVGFSNGASMALRYTSERPDQVRAVVSVAGQLPRDPAVRPSGRVPLLEVYGTADPLRPYEIGVPESPGRAPGNPTPTLPTRDTVAAFVAMGLGTSEHEVLPDADLDPTDGTRVRTERWADRGGTLAVLRSIVGGGHTWPSSRGQFSGGENFGITSGELDASAEAVAFVLDPEREGRDPGR
jgi:polyhydroxybutyrate depolymerase